MRLSGYLEFALKELLHLVLASGRTPEGFWRRFFFTQAA